MTDEAWTRLATEAPFVGALVWALVRQASASEKLATSISELKGWLEGRLK